MDPAGKTARGVLHPRQRLFRHQGAAAEAQADDTHYPGTYIAGGYNRVRTEIAGRIVENEELVNMPNCTDHVFKVGGTDTMIAQIRQAHERHGR